VTQIEPAETIEAVVGAPRHAVDHIGRAVTAEQRVYILHSERCRARYADLRECPYSLALDRGIDVEEWAGFEDQPVKLWIRVRTMRLIPLHLETRVHRVADPAPVHWEGDAPTSMHGNGATSFERTSRIEAEVTCRLCLTLLTREAIERGDLAVDHGDMYSIDQESVG
jgi:hypothetical protein